MTWDSAMVLSPDNDVSSTVQHCLTCAGDIPQLCVLLTTTMFYPTGGCKWKGWDWKDGRVQERKGRLQVVCGASVPEEDPTRAHPSPSWHIHWHCGAHYPGESGVNGLLLLITGRKFWNCTAEAVLYKVGRCLMYCCWVKLWWSLKTKNSDNCNALNLINSLLIVFV